MTLSGKPALVEARLGSLPADAQRELRQRITVIRERLGLIESAVNAFESSDTTGLEAQITALQSAVSALGVRVTAVETDLASLGASARLITTHTAADDIVANQAVREDASGAVRPVDMTASFNDDAQFAIGVAIADAAAGASVQICRAGVVSTSGAGWLVDATVFCGENGELVQVPVGPVYIPIGYAISEDAVQVLPQGWTTDVYHNGIFVGTRQRLNFVDGADIVLQVEDDNTNDRVNIIMGTTAGGAVFPGVGAMTLSGLAPNVGLGVQTVLPGVGSMTLAGLVPQIIVPMFAQPGAGAMVMQGLAPSIAATLSVNPGAGAMVLAGLAPQIVVPAVAAPGSGAMTLAGLTPSVIVSVGSVTAQPGAGALTLQGYAPVASPYTFYRDFTDLSTAGLTVYKGTVSAASGQLAGTPTSGSVHERVYFDGLPVGSPTDISGAFDIVANFAMSGVSSALSAVTFFIQSDDGSTNTIQNGYWVDLVVQFNIIRFIKFVGGSGSQIGSSFALPANSGTHTLRVTHDGSGNYDIYFDGVKLNTSSIVETTFTHGQFGIVFFSNPGAAPPLVNYGINYTP